ncbi:MAG: D-alanyl-D-alanine carboxypeptidase family protein [Oscillospiraceae bacterium]
MLLLMCGFVFSSNVEALDVSAKSAVIIEANSRNIIFEKNAHEKLPMASTTKIMTSLITLEAGIPNDVFRPTDEMLMVEGTSMGLLAGDTVTVKNLVYGMLLSSGNDAANCAAIKVGGNLQNFAKIMNKRAKIIGMDETNFVTPSGLDAKEHYSTAYDMSLLGAEAIKNPDFREICSSKSARISFGNPPYMRMLSNHNNLLNTYPYAIGIKTGYTKKSKRCLVSAAQKDGVMLVAVTLNAPNDWNDHKEMFDYGFSQYSSVPLDSNLSDVILNVIGSKTKQLPVKCANEPKAALMNGRSGEVVKKIFLKQFEYAPIGEGKIVGVMCYYLDDKLLYETPIVTTTSAESNTIVKNDSQKKSFLKELFEKFKK